MADGPMLERMEESARSIGRVIGNSLAANDDAHPDDPRTGFALLVFTMTEPDDPRKWMTYISNADRDDMLDAMREFIEKHEPGTIDVVAGVRRREDGSVWICKRKSDGDHAGLAGMWEYPGGKVEEDEQLRDALIRELHEEFPGVRNLYVGRVLDSIESRYEGTVYRVTFFEVSMEDPDEYPTHSEVRWMTPEEACAADHLPSGTIFNARHLTAEPSDR